MPKKWNVVSSRYELQDRWISVRADHCITADGITINPFYIVEAPDFVHAIASDKAGKIILVKQYRHGLGQISIELPGGIMDHTDENVIATAKRELREETGYLGGDAKPFLSLSPDPARYSNRVHFVRITDVDAGLALPETTESIDVMLVSKVEALKLALNGDIQHAGHVGAILASINVD